MVSKADVLAELEQQGVSCAGLDDQLQQLGIDVLQAASNQVEAMTVCSYFVVLHRKCSTQSRFPVRWMARITS
jgi:hypothetical protein